MATMLEFGKCFSQAGDHTEHCSAHPLSETPQVPGSFRKQFYSPGHSWGGGNPCCACAGRRSSSGWAQRISHQFCVRQVLQGRCCSALGSAPLPSAILPWRGLSWAWAGLCDAEPSFQPSLSPAPPSNPCSSFPFNPCFSFQLGWMDGCSRHCCCTGCQQPPKIRVEVVGCAYFWGRVFSPLIYAQQSCDSHFSPRGCKSLGFCSSGGVSALWVHGFLGIAGGAPVLDVLFYLHPSPVIQR